MPAHDGKITPATGCQESSRAMPSVAQKKKNTKMKTQTHMACIYVDKGNPEMRILDTKSMVVIRGVGKMYGWLRNGNELRLAHTLSYENYKQISHAVWIMIMRCGIVGPA